MTSPPQQFGQLEGYEHERIEADGQIADGVPIVLEAVNTLSGGTAGIVVWYEGSAATAANKAGGLPGVISNWAHRDGIHQSLDGCFFDIDDANTTEVIATFLRI